ADKDARIICYPELFLTPWFPRHEERALLSWAVDVSGEHLERFRIFSENMKTVLLVPFFEYANDKYYNSTAIFDSGKIVGTYRKIHVPNLPLYREQFYFSSGDSGFPVFATSQGKIGVQICWDNFFPEGSRILALKGAEIIFSPTAASLDTHPLWERAITANAFANNLFIFRVNRVGQEEGISFYGRSFCAGPWGEMASELAGGKEAIVIADINLAERKAASETWGFLKHRMPGAYGELLK
ncbi:MAG TPA: nitrilase-related carbon-nitrogen hydrolase, partial [Nitrospirota bacterium]|nr:nitrilase-related carbon-nitrogen hydrolase [Nitrospirota bacterium]